MKRGFRRPQRPAPALSLRPWRWLGLGLVGLETFANASKRNSQKECHC